MINYDDIKPTNNRVINDNPIAGENGLERALRPKKLLDYVGQKKIVEQIKIIVKASMIRKEPIDHILLFGPPGLGKTTLAHILAEERCVNLKTTSGPILEKPGDLAAILTNLEENDILLKYLKNISRFFLQEFFVHLLNKIRYNYYLIYNVQCHLDLQR